MAKTKAKAKVKAKPKAPVKKKVAVKAKAKKPVKAAAKKAQPKPAVKKIIAPIASAKKSKLAHVSEFVTPLDDRMIVQISEGEKRTAGGLYIPDTVTNVAGNREGTVLSVGRGHRDTKGRLRPMDVKKGDKIIFAAHIGAKFDYEGQNLIILRETDVMGVLK